MEILKSEYSSVGKLLWDMRRLLAVTAALFLFFAAAAYFASSELYRESPQAIEEHMQAASDMITSKGVIDEEGEISALPLFFNNFTAAMTSLALGAVPFLFLPVISLLLNGGVIGMVFGMMQAVGMGGLLELFVLVGPHGVFEIPALLISIAFGLRLCMATSALLRGRVSGSEVLSLIGGMARAAVLLLLPLLTAAAFIEAYITPAVVSMALG